MTYRGHVKQGVIVLDRPAELPEGMEVEVRATDGRSRTAENLSPLEALRQLQKYARLTPRQAEEYLQELRAERLAAEDRHTA